MKTLSFVMYYNNGANPFFMLNVSVKLARLALAWQLKHNHALIAYTTVISEEA